MSKRLDNVIEAIDFFNELYQEHALRVANAKEREYILPYTKDRISRQKDFDEWNYANRMAQRIYRHFRKHDRFAPWGISGIFKTNYHGFHKLRDIAERAEEIGDIKKYRKLKAINAIEEL